MNADRILAEIRRLADLADRTTDTADLDRFTDAFRELDAHLSAGGAPPEAWREGPDAPDADRPGISFTREQVEAWAGFPLTDEQVEELEDVLPNSSFPDTVNTVVTEALGWTDPAEFPEA